MPRTDNAERENMTTFDCSGCGHQYQVSEKYAGKKVRCKKCNTINIIPGDNSDEYIEETSYPESGSGKKIMVILCLVTIAFIVGGFGAIVYSQHTKVTECLADCESFHTQAQARWENKDYAGAKDIYKSILERTSQVSSNSKDLDFYIQGSKEKIHEADSLIFADKYLAEIKEKYQQATTLFMSKEMPEAQKIYQEIIGFLNEHQRQQDTHFSGIYNASQKKSKLVSDIADIQSDFKDYYFELTNLKNDQDIYKMRSRIQETNQQCDSIIAELSSIPNPSSNIENLTVAFKQMKTELNDLYQSKVNKAKLAVEIKNQFERELKRQEEDESRKRVVQESADKKIKDAAHTLFPKAKETIKSALKSPSSASFEDATYAVYKTDEDAKYVLVAELDDQHGEYTQYSQFKKDYPDGVILWFSGKVNAQNSFGAMLQTSWFCVYFYSPSQDDVKFLKYNIK